MCESTKARTNTPLPSTATTATTTPELVRRGFKLPLQLIAVLKTMVIQACHSGVSIVSYYPRVKNKYY